VHTDPLKPTNKQPRIGSALFPEMEAVQHDVQDGIETPLVLEADSISTNASDERTRKLIPWSNLIRCLEVVGTGGAIEQHLMQAVDLAEMDAWRNVQAILGYGFACARDESTALSLPQEALSGFLDFTAGIEQIPLGPDYIEQNRPKGKLLTFEQPPHMKPVQPRNLVSSDSTGTSARILEFRRP
jgi:hypothetical protein